MTAVESITLGQIIEYASKATITVLLAGALYFIIQGGRKRVWVWGYQLDELRADKNAQIERMRIEHQAQLERERALTKEWQILAERNLLVAESVVHDKPPAVES